MLKEQKLYIELYLEKCISLTVEGDYHLDKFGNFVFKNKPALIEQIAHIISETGQEMNISAEEITECLLSIYKKRSKVNEHPEESLEIISILGELNSKDEKKIKQNNDDKERVE